MTEITLTRNDAQLRGTTTGTGPTVLLLHAGGESRNVWAPVTAVLNHLSEEAPALTAPSQLNEEAPASAMPSELDAGVPVAAAPSQLGGEAPASAMPSELDAGVPVAAAPSQLGGEAPASAMPSELDAGVPVAAAPTQLGGEVPVSGALNQLSEGAPAATAPSQPCRGVPVSGALNELSEATPVATAVNQLDREAPAATALNEMDGETSAATAPNQVDGGVRAGVRAREQLLGRSDQAQPHRVAGARHEPGDRVAGVGRAAGDRVGGVRRGAGDRVLALRSVAYDLRGHGDSSGRATRLGLIAEDVAAMIRHEQAPVVVVGASLGGLAAIAALADPHTARAVVGLILVDVLPNPDPARVRAWLDERGLRDQHDELVEDILDHGPELLATATKLELPILLVRAGPTSPLTDAEVDAFRAVNPTAAVAQVPDAGHLIARDAPAELAHLIAAQASTWLRASC